MVLPRRRYTGGAIPFMGPAPTWFQSRMLGQQPLSGRLPLHPLGCDDVLPRVPASQCLACSEERQRKK
jgi:hypothetical protein